MTDSTKPEIKCCANCHFGVDGDGETVWCSVTGEERTKKDACCESYDGEHPDAEYWRKDSEYKYAEIAKLESEVARLTKERDEAWDRGVRDVVEHSLRGLLGKPCKEFVDEYVEEVLHRVRAALAVER